MAKHVGFVPIDIVILGRVVHRGGEEEGVVAAGDGLVVAAFLAQVGAEHLQGAELLQVLEVGVGLLVLWDTIQNQRAPFRIRGVNSKRHQGNTEPNRAGSSRRNLSGMPDRRLHDVALLQQHLDEKRGDVPVPPVTHAVFFLSSPAAAAIIFWQG
jgi:hypothetical protein